jgi:hypothetical protein
VSTTTKRSISRYVISTVVGLTVLAPASGLLTPAVAASGRTCRVTNTTLAKRYHTSTGSVLQLAIDEANSGDTLRVRGRCVGVYEVASKSLTLLGLATRKYPVPSLDAAGANDQVVRITSTATVEFDDLAITGSNCTQCDGGGIFNSGTVAMAGSAEVVANLATVGAGIYNDATGTVILRDAASVHGNTAASSGGGVLNLGTIRLNGSASLASNTAGTVGGGIANASGTLTLNGSSSVTGNHADVNGGGVFGSGTVTLNDQATVSANSAGALGAGGLGGGVLIGAGGTLSLRDASSVAGNTAATEGGGVYNNGSSVTLSGTSLITSNTAGERGGGVSNVNGGTVTVQDSGAITGNSAPTCPDVYPC